ncbi:HAD-IA family hydrolase [Corynebacterium poyangense]|uniref:HAD-IA family hydrolase n=1 Tax=Corynebacterium poyangense TaxID=2684405 RepID=A0A7H0SNV7_9CORY|nr:HAD family phosphatase [Corynebacterium poyangense]MBZ8177788.1 HAD-IA family hydrolase [Corynebacterium poyangense]QNQ90232.1 HAD-IA family hydrolase [Corynebacterium poyangense]
MLAAIFWDMDGTMVDSEPLWGVATYELSERLGRRLTPELRAQTVGGSFNNTLEICAEHAGYDLQESDYREQRTILFHRVQELFHSDLEPQPGVVELLEDLAAQDIKMYVTTNTERAIADSSIAAVGEHFFVDSIVGDEVPRQKPYPDMYLKAADLAEANPEQCLVFEDSLTGITAALEAGCRVIAVPSDSVEKLPQGAVSLEKLRIADGCPADRAGGFQGVTASDVIRWFTQISTN